jgi:hypothetical protein
VNQFVASEMVWKANDLHLVQRTHFPHEQKTLLTIHRCANSRFIMKIRRPIWATGAQCHLNNAELVTAAGPDGYWTIQRDWRAGDQIEIVLPMTLRIEPMPDDDLTFAFLYGPTVLAAETNEPLELAEADPREMVRIVDVDRLVFEVRLKNGAHVPLVPLKEIAEQPFGVYFRLGFAESRIA